MQAQRDIGILGGIARGFLHGHAIECDLFLALAGHFRKRNGRMAQMHLRKLIHAVAVKRRLKHIGDKHRVVEQRHANAALQEYEIIIFEILRDLQNRFILKQRLQPREHILLRQLLDLGAVGEIEAVAFSVPARNITGLARCHRQRHAAKPRLHRIERCRFRIDANDAHFPCPRDPVIEALQRRHGFISIMIDRFENRIAVRDSTRYILAFWPQQARDWQREARLSLSALHRRVQARLFPQDRQRAQSHPDRRC